MFEFQNHLIFPIHAVAPAGPLPKGAERLSLTTPDGSTLVGTHIPPDDHSGDGILVLGFGGNAWNGQDVAEFLHELFPDQDTVAFHYRGYSPSTGSPSSEALMADAPLVYDYALRLLKPKRVVAVGFSIGSGIAASLAAERKLDGVILVTPFDSLKAVAVAMYPWLPIGHFFDQQINAAGAIAKVKAPVAIVAAERDEIVPTALTDALRRQVPNLVFDRTIARAGHNDLYGRSEFQAAMRESFDCLKA